MISNDNLINREEQQPITITSVHYVEDMDGDVEKNRKNQSKKLKTCGQQQSDKLNNEAINTNNNCGVKRSPFGILSRANRLLIMLGMTFFYFLIELVFGYVSHSMALIADSFHMMSDVMALTIAFGCLKKCQKYIWLG
ncbi:unnamed protein product [Meloidogyne enterolobii]|uniref:Uncharacterized protein n=1 Tax=Meloidogyne enterolobii TaxID=390850 RepID=A0ACB0ZI94_MELEN